jgi:hypothetical protein
MTRRRRGHVRGLPRRPPPTVPACSGVDRVRVASLTVLWVTPRRPPDFAASTTVRLGLLVSGPARWLTLLAPLDTVMPSESGGLPARLGAPRTPLMINVVAAVARLLL